MTLDSPDFRRLTARLSVREVEIVRRVGFGESSEEMARGLGIAVRTVDTHLAKIRHKLNLHRTADLVRLALISGLVLPPEEDRAPLALRLIESLTPEQRGELVRALVHGLAPAPALPDSVRCRVEPRPGPPAHAPLRHRTGLAHAPARGLTPGSRTPAPASKGPGSAQ